MPDSEVLHAVATKTRVLDENALPNHLLVIDSWYGRMPARGVIASASYGDANCRSQIKPKGEYDSF